SERPSARICFRSSSDPLKPPPSQTGRQVTMTGRRRPARAPATLGSLTESSRSSTRSASATASRCWRNSAVVAAVTTTHSRGLDIKNQKKSLVSLGGLKRLGNSFARWRLGQGGCPFSRAPIPPPRRRGHTHIVAAVVAEGKGPGHQRRDDSKPQRSVSTRSPFLLDQQALLP